MELFKLYFSPLDNPARFKAVIDSSVGQQEDDLNLPFFDGGKDWRTTLIKTLESPTFQLRDFEQDGEQDWMVEVGILNEDRLAFHLDLLKNVGQALYRSLFPIGGRLESLFKSALRDTERQNAYLHIQLTFQEDSARRSRFADYPWELLHDSKKFLAHRKVTFSRYIADESAPPKLPPVEKIDVLLVSSAAFDSNQGLAKLSNSEQQAIPKGLEKAQAKGHIRLTPLEYATTECLRAYLTEHQPPQVVHFDGHGLFGKRCPNEECRAIHKGIKVERCRKCNTQLPAFAQGYLVFEDAQGEADYVSAEEFGQLLQKASARDRKNSSSRITLAVLSACQSGMSVMGDSVFNGTAQNLISNGIPSVVAMQYSVTVDGAVKFAEQFYRSLGKKNSLALAVSKGREAMGLRDEQWFRPVLYLRWRDNEGGQLFNLKNKNKPIRRRLGTSTACGVVIAIGVAAVRSAGYFEWIELSAYDILMNHRIPDRWDKNIVIVGADEKDLNEEYGNPLKDKTIQALLSKLTDTYGIEIIGLDIDRHKPTDSEQDYTNLTNYIQKNKTVSVVCRSQQGEYYQGKDKPIIPLTNKNSQSIDKNAKEELAEEIKHNKSRVGFNDLPADGDPRVASTRRQILRMEIDPDSRCQTEYPLSYQLAKQYLEKEGYQSSWEKNDSGDLFFFKEGEKKKPFVFRPLGVSDWTWGFSGWTTEGPSAGYQKVHKASEFGYKPGPYQVMANYLNSKSPEVIHFREILGEKANPDIVRKKLTNENTHKKKIVLIGYIDIESKGGDVVDIHPTPIDSRMPGVFIHAHMVSQIIQVVAGTRKLIWYWAPEGEFLWILAWSIVGGILVWRNRPLINLVIIGIGLVFVPLIICWVIFQFDYGWIPLIPPVLSALITYGIIILIDLRERELSLVNMLDSWTQ